MTILPEDMANEDSSHDISNDHILGDKDGKLK